MGWSRKLFPGWSGSSDLDQRGKAKAFPRVRPGVDRDQKISIDEGRAKSQDLLWEEAKASSQNPCSLFFIGGEKERARYRAHPANPDAQLTITRHPDEKGDAVYKYPQADPSIGRDLSRS